LDTSEFAKSSDREKSIMILEYFLGAAVAVFVTGYLLYALARPERF